MESLPNDLQVNDPSQPLPNDRALVRLARNEEKVRRGFWDKVRRTVDRVPFLQEAIAAYYCARDPKTPLQVKAVLLGALAYFILPADLIPDIIAWFGFGDDATVLFAAIQTVSPHIKDEHRNKAQAKISELSGASLGDEAS